MSGTRKHHYSECPKSKDKDASCVCDVLDNEQVETAVTPSLAEMIRRAKQQGHIKPVPGYGPV